MTAPTRELEDELEEFEEDLAAPSWTRLDWAYLVLVGLALALGLALLHGATTGKQLVDLQVYRMGASALIHGHSPYAAVLPGQDLPYTYTPFSTVVFAPLAVLPWRIAMVAHTVVSLLALFVVSFLVLREVEGHDRTAAWLVSRTAFATAALYWSEPVLQTLGFGQINLVLMLLVVVDLLALRHTRFAGVLIGIAAGIKLTPLVFVVYLACTRRVRTAVVAALSAAGTVALGGILLPKPTWLYFTKLAFEPKRIGNPGFVANQSLEGSFTRLFGGYDATRHAWMVAAVVMFAFGMWLARGVHRRLGEPAGLAVCAVTGLLVSPISWSHHWVWWSVPALLVATHLGRRPSARAWALAVALAVPFYVGPFWRIAHRNLRGPVPVGWQRPPAETYVAMALVALVATAVWLEVSRRTRARAAAGHPDQIVRRSSTWGRRAVPTATVPATTVATAPTTPSATR